MYYVIQYRAENSVRSVNEETMSGRVLEHRIAGLSPSTNYRIRVAASNSEGDGTFSDFVMATTHAVPGKLIDYQ